MCYGSGWERINTFYNPEDYTRPVPDSDYEHSAHVRVPIILVILSVFLSLMPLVCTYLDYSRYI